MKTIEEYVSASNRLYEQEAKLKAERKDLLEQMAADYAEHKVGDVVAIKPGIYNDGRTSFMVKGIKAHISQELRGKIGLSIKYSGLVVRKDGSVGGRDHAEWKFFDFPEG